MVPGSGQAGFKAGATVPIRQARPEVVEIDDFFNMFDDKARVGSRNSLDGYGTGFAGRGRDLNTAIDELQPLLDDLEPVAKNLASPPRGSTASSRRSPTRPPRWRPWPRSRPRCS